MKEHWDCVNRKDVNGFTNNKKQENSKCVFLLVKRVKTGRGGNILVNQGFSFCGFQLLFMVFS